jgi:DNA modification methylase
MVAFALRADGWWLRSDIVWVKPNPMPESVRDRPTSAHEHVFLLAKSERYYYDAEAIRETATGQNEHDLTGGGYAPPGQSAHTGTRRGARGSGNGFKRAARLSYQDAGGEARGDDKHWTPPGDGKRQTRNVWPIATQPLKEAHFAAMPPALAERCIRAGSPPVIGRVLDPFSGAGTTGLVADRLHRDATLIDINRDYVEMAKRRIRGEAPLLHTSTGAAP